MTEHRTTARSYGALLILTLIVSGCASAREKRDREIAEADLGRVPHGEVLTWDDKPIGEYLTELNLRMERYFALKTRTDARSVQVREVLETEIERYVAKREDELIFELSQGPPKNRVVAAAALGFSRTEQALGPLLAAVDDPSLEVHRQAVLGLGLLADPATP
ncbi:MAG: HEAT repeat domain-containing protein, partial [Planctomycetota bacterium]